MSRPNVGDIIKFGEYGTAQAQHVLEGYTLGTEGGIVEGTVTNWGSRSYTPGNSTHIILKGYYNGDGRVPAVSFDASKVLSDTTIAGTVGTMPDNGAVTINPSAVDQTIAAGYHNGAGKVTKVTVDASKVLTGTTIAGTAGTMTNNGVKTITPGATDQSLNGYYANGSKVAGDADLIAANIMTGKNIFGVAGSAKRVAIGTFTTDSSSHFTLNLGWKCGYFMAADMFSSSAATIFYNRDFSTTKYQLDGGVLSLDTTNYINSTTVSLDATKASTVLKYFAIEE